MSSSNEPKEKKVISLGITQVIIFTVVIFLAGVGVVGWANAQYESKESADTRTKALVEKITANEESVDTLKYEIKGELSELNKNVQSLSDKMSYMNGYLKQRDKRSRDSE
jgi:uncharacterized protein YgiM (DUF1202 family)